MRRILIIQGHPDPRGGHFGHALADAYAAAALAAGHEVRRLEVAQLDFSMLRDQADWQGPPPPALEQSQAMIGWAEHIVLVFPLWLGTMPALLKAFLEQVLRPGFALIYEGHRFPQRGLTGKTGHVIVTMGMPAFWYRWFFRAHGVRGLERSILGFCGVKPVHETLIGLVESKDDRVRERWLGKMTEFGRRAA
jgi:putative NADPH-quinone reductase